MRFFDKTPYEGEPSDHIRQVIKKLAKLGKHGVVAARGNGFSANILGTIYMGKDGDDPVLRGKKDGMDECTCHIHVMWDKVHDYVLEREDVGYGPEPVIYLVDENGEPIINIFFPGMTFEEIETLLVSAEEAITQPTPKPFRYVFMICFKSETNLSAYIEFWEEMSRLIQQEAGAQGTRLHRIQGDLAVLAIAEWGSKEARVLAYEEIARKYPPDHKIHWQADKFGGKHSFIVEADEIGKVLP